MNAIRVETKHEATVAYFTAGKILSIQDIEQLGHQLQDAVTQAAHKKLLLNFRGINIMGSEMITKLIYFNKSCKAQGVALKLCEISAGVMEVFKIMSLGKDFDIHASEEKAIESFSKKGWFG